MLDQLPPALIAPAPEAEVPADLKAMIEAAMAEGDEAVIAKLFGYAEKARPDARAALARMRGAWLKGQEEKRLALAEAERAKLAGAGPLDGWTGRVEFGASWSTGPVESLGLLGAVEAERQGLKWTHKLLARADVQDTDGVRAVERIVASWQPRYTLDKTAYAFGLGQYERDPALGYQSRFSAALGAGWRLREGGDLRLSLEGGPAFRLTRTDAASRARLAGRGSLDLGWQISSRLEFSQRASLFYEDGSSSGFIATALDSKVSDKINLRLSYEYRIEEDVVRGLDNSGSISRASLVYKL